MFALLIIFTMSVTIEGQECIPCPDMCTCATYSDGVVDCSGLDLTSVLPGCELSGSFERVDFSDNNIRIIDWGNIPSPEGTFCDIYLQNNMISQAVGSISVKRCDFLDIIISNNSLNTVPTDFVVFYGYVDFVDVILVHNSITAIMPGGVKIHNSTYFTVDLSFNKLSYIHPSAFDFHGDGDGDVFKFGLILENNNLVSFSILNAWRSVTRPVTHFYIDLSNNEIEDIQVENDNNEFDDIYRHIHVNVDNNNWNCDCNHNSIAFENSTLRGLLAHDPYECPHFLCGSPHVLRNKPVLWLAPDDFVCLPRVDPLKDVTNVVINPGETAIIVCPVTFAHPPITHYEWTFSPLLSDCERELFGEEFWDVRFTRRTSSNIIEVENVQREGIYVCEAVNPMERLSVNISISFAKPQSKNPFVIDSFNKANFTSPFLREKITPLPDFFLKVLLVVVCTVLLFLIFASVIMAVLTFKFSNFLHSKKTIARKFNRDTTKGKQENPRQHAGEYNEYRRRPDVDQEEYCVPSEGIYQTLGSNN